MTERRRSLQVEEGRIETRKLSHDETLPPLNSTDFTVVRQSEVVDPRETYAARGWQPLCTPTTESLSASIRWYL